MGQPVFGGDGVRTEEELRRWSAGVQEKAERYQSMQAEVARVSVTESSRDDVVRVTVDSTGAVTDLEIADAHRDLPGPEVARLVLTTMRKAQARITPAVAEIMERSVGDDPATVAAVVGSYRQRFPEPEPEQASRSVGAEEMRLGEVAEDEPPRPAQRRRPPRPDDDDDWDGPTVLS